MTLINLKVDTEPVSVEQWQTLDAQRVISSVRQMRKWDCALCLCVRFLGWWPTLCYHVPVAMTTVVVSNSGTSCFLFLEVIWLLLKECLIINTYRQGNKQIDTEIEMNVYCSSILFNASQFIRSYFMLQPDTWNTKCDVSLPKMWPQLDMFLWNSCWQRIMRLRETVC